MLRHSIAALSLLAAGTAAPNARVPRDTRLLGRWDITITTPDGPRPSWLEIDQSGNDALVGRFVAIVGSQRPISRVESDSNGFRFAIPPQWEGGSGDLAVEGHLTDASHLAGSITFPDGKRFDWTAVRAPALRRSGKPSWGKPQRLFDGRDLNGWRALGENQWVAANGVLRSPHSGSNLVTDRAFGDFKLHVEFRYPSGSNSGIYLRGRYEVQIEDSPRRPVPHPDEVGGVYGLLAPNEAAANPAGQWQAYDITLVGRRVTVVLNGKTVISDAVIAGPTGGALDANEGAPGPIYLQGDHGAVEFRKVVITPATR